MQKARIRHRNIIGVEKCLIRDRFISRSQRGDAFVLWLHRVSSHSHWGCTAWTISDRTKVWSRVDINDMALQRHGVRLTPIRCLSYFPVLCKRNIANSDQRARKIAKDSRVMYVSRRIIHGKSIPGFMWSQQRTDLRKRQPSTWSSSSARKSPATRTCDTRYAMELPGRYVVSWYNGMWLFFFFYFFKSFSLVELGFGYQPWISSAHKI